MAKIKIIHLRKIYLTQAEAMEYTGWSIDYFKALRYGGKLNCSKPCGQKMVMYRIDDINCLIEKGMQWKHGVKPSRLMQTIAETGK